MDKNSSFETRLYTTLANSGIGKAMYEASMERNKGASLELGGMRKKVFNKDWGNISDSERKILNTSVRKMDEKQMETYLKVIDKIKEGKEYLRGGNSTSPIPKFLQEYVSQMKIPTVATENVSSKTESSKKKISSPNKPYRSTPTEDLITMAKDNGLSWKESSDPRINRMRVIMALKAENITPDSSQKTKTKKSKKDETKKQTKAKEETKATTKKSEDKKSKYSSVKDLNRVIKSKNDMDRLIDEGYKDYYKWDTGEDPDEDYDEDYDEDDDDGDDDGYYGNLYDNWIPPKMIQQEAEYIKDFGIVEAINDSIKEDNLDGEDIDYDDPAHGEQVIEDLKSDDPDKVLEALKYIKSTVDDLPFGSALMASVIENMKLPE